MSSNILNSARFVKFCLLTLTGTTPHDRRLLKTLDTSRSSRGHFCMLVFLLRRWDSASLKWFLVVIAGQTRKVPHHLVNFFLHVSVAASVTAFERNISHFGAFYFSLIRCVKAFKGSQGQRACRRGPLYPEDCHVVSSLQVWHHDFWKRPRRRMSERPWQRPLGSHNNFFSFIQNVYVSVSCMSCIELWICWEQ